MVLEPSLLLHIISPRSFSPKLKSPTSFVSNPTDLLISKSKHPIFSLTPKSPWKIKFLTSLFLLPNLYLFSSLFFFPYSINPIILPIPIPCTDTTGPLYKYTTTTTLSLTISPIFSLCSVKSFSPLPLQFSFFPSNFPHFPNTGHYYPCPQTSSPTLPSVFSA